MSAILDVSCAACGEGLAGAPGEQARCRACDAQLLIMRRGACLEVGPTPVLDRAAARAAFARLFEVDGEPEPGPPQTRASLFFAPFYELTGTMVGIGADGRSVHRWAHSAVAAIEDHDELGLDRVEASRIADEDSELQAVAALRGLGAVLDPERERDQVEAFLSEGARIPADGDQPVLVDRRLRLLFYPLWRLRYEVRGLTYQATVDALTGTVLHARVPAKQRRRAFLGVCAAACLGYLLGSMARHPWLGLPAVVRAIEGASALWLLSVLSVVTVAAGLYILLLNATWNALRYRNELIYESGLKTRVLIHRPAETALDRVTDLVKGGWQTLFAPRRYDR